jgi:hypothetical protein
MSSISCSSPSLDIWRCHCVEENNSACKSLSRGSSGSALRHLGGAPVSSSVSCSSAPPSALHDSWRQCVEVNRNACKLLDSLSRGCSRSALMRLGGAPVSSFVPSPLVLHLHHMLVGGTVLKETKILASSWRR